MPKDHEAVAWCALHFWYSPVMATCFAFTERRIALSVRQSVR